jgi:acetyl esterase/lipase
VIYFVHGGGYVLGQPGQYLPFLLRLAESILDRGLSVSIFALDYSLAPETPFPAQITQTVAGHAYLCDELGIANSKIALVGDSAGGNLLLGFLSHLHNPIVGHGSSAKPSATRTKPELGLFMLSPWVTFKTTHATYSENVNLDVLSKPSLQYWSRLLLQSADAPIVALYTDFVHPPPPAMNNDSSTTATVSRNWRAILPPVTWVTGGGHELFIGDIARWVQLARQDGARVLFDIKPGEAHNWQFAQCLAEQRRYLEQPFEVKIGETCMDGLDAIGSAIVDAVNSCQMMQESTSAI